MMGLGMMGCGRSTRNSTQRRGQDSKKKGLTSKPPRGKIIKVMTKLTNKLKEKVRAWLNIKERVTDYVMVYSPEKHATKVYYLKGTRRGWSPLYKDQKEVGFKARVYNRDLQVRSFRADRIISLAARS